MPFLIALNPEKVPSFLTPTVMTVVIALIVLGLLVKLPGLLKGRGGLPYVGAGPLLTPAERYTSAKPPEVPPMLGAAAFR